MWGVGNGTSGGVELEPSLPQPRTRRDFSCVLWDLVCFGAAGPQCDFRDGAKGRVPAPPAPGEPPPGFRSPPPGGSQGSPALQEVVQGPQVPAEPPSCRPIPSLPSAKSCCPLTLAAPAGCWAAGGVIKACWPLILISFCHQLSAEGRTAPVSPARSRRSLCGRGKDHETPRGGSCIQK